MSDKLYSEESIQAIANSIRAKNGTSETYTVSEMSSAISALPTNLTTKTITANGTYNASSDDADGYSSVTVAVEGYAKKSIANTPTAIATFNASALPMPSLTVGIEAVQAGNGDPSPTNVRPFTGWSAVNRYRCVDTTEIEYFANLSKGIYGVVDLGSLNWTYQTSIVEGIGVFRATISDMSEGSKIFSCPLYENVGTRSYLATKDMTMARFNTTTSIVLIRNDSYTNETAFKTAMNGVKLIYELTEPTAPTVTASEMQAIMSSYNVTSHTYTTQLKDGQGNPMTCYGGELSNVNGVQTLELTHGYIASYNGETLPSTWISDRDVYAEGTTPTIGAEVVYTLATPEEIAQDNLPIASQSGTNNLWADSGDIQSGEYMEAL